MMVFLIHWSGSYRPAYISKTENSPINWLFSICFLFYRPKVSSRWCVCGRVGRHHIITHFKLSHTDIHGFFGIHLQTLHGRCEVCRLLQDEVQRCTTLVRSHLLCLLPSAASHGGRCDAGCCIVTPYGSKTGLC